MKNINLAVLLFLFILLPVSVSNAQGTQNDRQRLNVTGNGEILVSPDMVIINFSIETRAKTASETVKQNAAKTNQVIEALKAKIGSEDKLSTTGYNLSPVYEYNNQSKKSEFQGYRATNSIIVTTYDLEIIGALIDSASDAGANNIQGLSFDSTKRNEYAREALVKAVKDARATADAVADAAGVKIVKIYQISPSYSYPIPVYKDYAEARMSNAPAAPPTPIEAGDISIRASVSMEFGIE